MPLTFVGSVPPLIVVAVVGDSEDGGRGGISDLELFVKSIGHMIKNCVTTELSSESSVHHVTINHYHTFTRGPEDTTTSVSLREVFTVPPHSRRIPGGIYGNSMWIPWIPYGIFLAESPAILV